MTKLLLPLIWLPFLMAVLGCSPALRCDQVCTNEGCVQQGYCVIDRGCTHCFTPDGVRSTITYCGTHTVRQFSCDEYDLAYPEHVAPASHGTPGELLPSSQ